MSNISRTEFDGWCQQIYPMYFVLPQALFWHQCFRYVSLRWRHNGHDDVSNHQPHHCLLNGLFVRRSKKTSKLRVTGLCAGNSPGTVEFPAQMASHAENVSIWVRHHDGYYGRLISSWLRYQIPNCHQNTGWSSVLVTFQVSYQVLQ